MAEITVRVDSDDFLREIKQYGSRAVNNVRGVLADEALEIVRDAKRLAPHDTGRLKSSVQILAKRFDGLGYDIGTNVEYADALEQIDTPIEFLEIRPGKRAGQYPFLRPAFKGRELIIEGKLRKAIEP